MSPGLRALVAPADCGRRTGSVAWNATGSFVVAGRRGEGDVRSTRLGLRAGFFGCGLRAGCKLIVAPPLPHEGGGLLAPLPGLFHLRLNAFTSVEGDSLQEPKHGRP